MIFARAVKNGVIDIEPGLRLISRPITTSADEIVTTISPISIYPNPAKNIFFIHQPEPLINRLFLLDITGRVVKEIALMERETVVNIDNLKNGIYFLKTEKGPIGKVVVNK